MFRNTLLRLAVALAICCGFAGCMMPSDPMDQVHAAYWLEGQNRYPMADYNLQTAIKTATKNGNDLALAEAHFALGNLYQSAEYHRPDAAQEFRNLGPYDGTYMNSINQYQAAIDSFGKIKSDIGVVKSQIGIGMAYSHRNEQGKACVYYRKAHTLYLEGKKTGNITHEPQIYLPGYKTEDEIAMALICQHCMHPGFTTRQACFQRFKK